jgi:NTE family protein
LGFPKLHRHLENCVATSLSAYPSDYPRRSRLIFQVDVFPAYGRVPANLAEVTERDTDIRYSSRTRLTTNNLREKHNVRHAINELHKLLPPELAVTEEAQRLYAYGCVTEMDIVQLIYRPMEPLGAFKDFEFSRSTMAAMEARAFRRAHRFAGLAVARADAQGAWCAVFDVMHDILTGRPEPV